MYKASLVSESDIVPVTWIASVRCANFWFQVLNDPIRNGKILRKLAEEATDVGMSDEKYLEDIEWRRGLDGLKVHDLSGSEAKDMLSVKSCMF